MTWIGWTLGMSGPTIKAAKAKLRARYSYAKQLNDSEDFGPDLADVLATYKPKRNAEGWQPALRVDGDYLRALDYNTQDSLGMIPHTAPVKPVMFTVEGHSSNMFAGPVADTGTQLEHEGLCHHQPIGYNNGSLPFDNSSGINELARLVGATTLDTGVPFPAGTPWALAGFSQGAIVTSYFYFDYLAPGKPLNWRLKDLRGYLAYGNPCRQTDSVADWARPWISKAGTHGLDPYRRFGLPGYPTRPDNMVDVYREGDIFAENTDDNAGKDKAAIYEAVMNDWFSNPYSLAARIVGLASNAAELVPQLIGIIQAIISGVAFLGDNPNPHYSPYDIGGGVDWMRARLTNG